MGASLATAYFTLRPKIEGVKDTNERGYDDHRWYFVRCHTAAEIRAGAYKVPEPVDKRTKKVAVDASGDFYDDVPFM